MKNILTALLSLSLISLGSCTKTGPQGPAGMGAIVENFTANTNDWHQAGNQGQTAYIYFDYSSSSISDTVLDRGTVLLYRYITLTSTSHAWQALPYSFYNSSGDLVNESYIYAIGKIEIRFENSSHTIRSLPNPNEYKLVVVPGMYKTAPCDYSDYNAVKAYFHLKD